MTFNDYEHRAHDDVEKAFEAAIAKVKEPKGMDIKELPDTETEHFPLVSPVPDKEVTPSIPAVPALPTPTPTPEKVPA